MASQVLLTISKDDVERARLTSELKYELDLQSKITHAKKQGMKLSDNKWQNVVADIKAELAEKDALIAKLQAELQTK